MRAADPSRRRPVIEVLYVQDCPHYRETLALVDRVRGELGIDTELRTTLIVDQAAADQARFAGSPTVRVDGRDVEPGSEPVTKYVLGCRLYRLEHRFAGQPEERWVREALVHADDHSRAPLAMLGTEAARGQPRCWAAPGWRQSRMNAVDGVDQRCDRAESSASSDTDGAS